MQAQLLHGPARGRKGGRALGERSKDRHKCSLHVKKLQQLEPSIKQVQEAAKNGRNFTKQLTAQKQLQQVYGRDRGRVGGAGEPHRAAEGAGATAEVQRRVQGWG